MNAVTERCFEEAATVLNLLSDLGIAVKAGRDAAGRPALMLRDRAGMLNPLLRRRLLDAQGEVIALLSRYDRFFVGMAVDRWNPRRLPQAAYVSLLEAHQPDGNGTAPREAFWAEGRWMAAVWGAKALEWGASRVSL